MANFQVLLLTIVACTVILQAKGLDLYRRRFYDVPVRRYNARDLYDVPLRTDDAIDLYERETTPCVDENPGYCGMFRRMCIITNNDKFVNVKNRERFVYDVCPRTCGVCGKK
ncbi:uncharacterized protein [Pocillopora verrucosa]|uniref:uncharacterized protein n=1 Tax=Pocillopora verrucosa TaxID=203993 RepID=UPI0027974904|nr:uncharacterized protein LOC131799180 [Pocillopora verrucosa]